MTRSLFLTCLLLISTILQGQVGFQSGKLNLEISASLDYSTEDLHWSIAGNADGKNPNILSELKWVDQAGWATSLNVRKKLGKAWFIEGLFSVKSIRKGFASDTDFSSDNRMDTSFYARLDTDSGNGYAGALLAGMVFPVSRGWMLELGAGWSANRQHLYLNTEGPGKGLGSSYYTWWRGGLVRLSSVIVLSRNLLADIKLSFSQLNYDATADWNMRDDFQHPLSFSHQGRGLGIQKEIKFWYHVFARLDLALRFQMLTMETGKGIDRVYYANGQTAITQLNNVLSKGHSLGFVLKMAF